MKNSNQAVSEIIEQETQHMSREERRKADFERVAKAIQQETLEQNDRQRGRQYEIEERATHRAIQEGRY